MHRQPLEARRSVHQRVPWQARHHAPGHGGVASAQLGIRANSAVGHSFPLPVVRQESHVGLLWRGISCGGQYSPLGHGI